MSTAYSKFLDCHDVCKGLLRGKSSCYVKKHIERQQEAAEYHSFQSKKQLKHRQLEQQTVNLVPTFSDGQPLYQPAQESDDDIYNTW